MSEPAADAVFETAPAKVNLALHVTARRPDFFHDLDSLVVFADLGDELAAVPAEPGEGDRLQITGPFAKGLGAGASNLVVRAVAAFRARFPDHVVSDQTITLHKNLPVAAGLGGGSADAAAALRLMAGLGTAPIPEHELAGLAAALGADVPACLLSRPCLVGGVGEHVVALKTFPPLFLVLVNPLVPVVTAEVFRHLTVHDNQALPPLPAPLTRPAQLGLWLEETRNDLENPAIEMVGAIAGLIAAMNTCPGCILARMSGSGATVFGLFGSGAQAHQAAHDLRYKLPGHWVAAAPVILPD